jgi:5-methylcytosine-specific restriction endonuclease McrA
VGNVVTWTARYSRWVPVTRIEVERVRFDMQLVQNPEVTGAEYQRGELAGWELRSYLLVKYGYQCVYCGKQGVPFEIDHQVPLSRGGTDRASNLVLSCHECNQRKSNQTATEFGHPDVAARAKVPLKDAAAVNATRYKVVEALRRFGIPIGTWSGGRTRWNRARFGLSKTHALDALAVGQIAGASAGKLKTLVITATGRGQHCRTNFTKKGFPYSHLMRQKFVRGFKTGDYVRAVVPDSLKTAGVHVGRVQVRKRGSFDITTHVGEIGDINAKHCHLVQRGDGYAYQSEAALPPHA